MKVIVDIPEEDYKEVLKDTYSGTPFENKIFTAIANGTPIPDNATNGDVIKAIFGYKRISHFNDNPPLVDVYGLDNNDDTDAVTFYEDWWNAPYQKGGKE